MDEGHGDFVTGDGVIGLFWCRIEVSARFADVVADTLRRVAARQMPARQWRSSALRRKVPLYLIEQRPAQTVRFQQVAETAYRGLVGHPLAARSRPVWKHRPRSFSLTSNTCPMTSASCPRGRTADVHHLFSREQASTRPVLQKRLVRHQEAAGSLLGHRDRGR